MKRTLNKKRIVEIQKNQVWNQLSYNQNTKTVEIKNLPQFGVFWLWTSYSLDEFEEWDREIGVIPANRLVRMTEGLSHLCTIEEKGFRLVMICSEKRYDPDSPKSKFYRFVQNQFDALDTTWGSLDILRSPQNDITRWKVSSVELDINQYQGTFEYCSIEWLWRMHYGVPVFNCWLFCE